MLPQPSASPVVGLFASLPCFTLSCAAGHGLPPRDAVASHSQVPREVASSRSTIVWSSETLLEWEITASSSGCHCRVTTIIELPKRQTLFAAATKVHWFGRWTARDGRFRTDRGRAFPPVGLREQFLFPSLPGHGARVVKLSFPMCHCSGETMSGKWRGRVLTVLGPPRSRVFRSAILLSHPVRL